MKLLTRDDLGPAPDIRTGRAVARIDTTAIGEGVRQAGNALANAGADLQAKWAQSNAVAMHGKLLDFQFTEDKLYDQSTRQMQPGQAQGFADKYTEGYKARASEFLKTIPEELKPQYDNALFENEQRIYGSAVGFERGEQSRYSLGLLGIGRNKEGNLTQVGGGLIQTNILPKLEMAAKLPTGDPNKKTILDQARTDTLAQIDGNPALSPIEKDQLKTAVTTMLNIEFVKALPPEERITVDPNTGTQTIGEQIVQVESGGNPLAVNDHSTAVGAGQFTEQTWLDTISKARPDLVEGKNRTQILALRTDPDLSLQMTEHLADENSKYLTSRGMASTPGNIYLAHFLGAGGAVALLGADPSLPADMVNPAAAEANPGVFYTDIINEHGRPERVPKTVGEVTAWAAEKMGGAVHANWSTLDIPYETKVAIAQDAAGEIVRQNNAAAQEATAQYGAALNALKNGILDGSVGMADVSAAYAGGNGWLKDAGDRAAVMKMITDRDKEGLDLQAAGEKIAAGDINPFSKDDQKAVDLVYEKGSLNGGADLLSGDPESIQNLGVVVERTGLIPSAAKERIQMGMWDSDPQTRDRAFAIADNLYRDHPDVFARSFSEGDLKRLQEYQQFASAPPEIRNDRLNPNADPTRVKQRTELEQQGMKIATDPNTAIKTDEILGSFDTNGWMWGGVPTAPIDPIAGQALRDDYNAFFAERFAALGNADSAKTAALALLHKKWGVTEIGSGTALMQFPPENYDNVINGSRAWMDTQLDQFVATTFPGAQRWAPVTMPFTEGAIGVGVKPSYAIGLIDKDGVYRTLLPPPGAPEGWPFDYGKAKAEAQAQFELDRQRALDSQARADAITQSGIAAGQTPDYDPNTGLPQ